MAESLGSEVGDAVTAKCYQKKKLFSWMVLNYRHCKPDRMDPWYFIFATVGAYEHSTVI